jgi:hypothetical protein
MFLSLFRFFKAVIWPAVQWGLLSAVLFLGIGGMGLVEATTHEQDIWMYKGVALMGFLCFLIAFFILMRRFVRQEPPFSPWDINFLPY